MNTHIRDDFDAGDFLLLAHNGIRVLRKVSDEVNGDLGSAVYEVSDLLGIHRILRRDLDETVADMRKAALGAICERCGETHAQSIHLTVEVSALSTREMLFHLCPACQIAGRNAEPLYGVNVFLMNA